jgi:hypothetical protein
MKNLMMLLSVGLVGMAFSSCTGQDNPLDRDRVPQPPSGTTERMKPINQIQNFEQKAAFGPLVSPRR